MLVDDSIIRGTTLVRRSWVLLRNSGAREVHLRISAPPSVASCHYGIDTPTASDELIAANHTVEEICTISWGRIPWVISPSRACIDVAASRHIKRGICDACFLEANYPVSHRAGVARFRNSPCFRDIEEE